MKQILFIFYIIGTFFTNQGAFEVTNTWPENGVLSLNDKNGNGSDIYIQNVDIEHEIGLLKEEWAGRIIEEQTLLDGGHLMRVHDESVIYPVDTIVIIPGRGFLLKAIFLKGDDPQTRGAFEEDVIQFMRVIARGGSHEKAWTDCVHTFANFFGRR